MATQVFTTWSDLYDQMKDDLASIDFTQKQFRIGSRVIEAQDLDDLQKHMEWVKGKVDEEQRENSNETGYGLFQLKNGGRGFE